MDVPALVASPPVIRDVLTRDGAYRLAKEIMKRWEALGHIVNCRVVEMPGAHGLSPYWSIRSDMVGGLPRKMANKLAA